MENETLKTRDRIIALFYVFQMSSSAGLEGHIWIQRVALANNSQALEISLYTLKDESGKRQ